MGNGQNIYGNFLTEPGGKEGDGREEVRGKEEELGKLGKR